VDAAEDVRERDQDDRRLIVTINTPSVVFESATHVLPRLTLGSFRRLGVDGDDWPRMKALPVARLFIPP
jgi:hypothetical protein